VGFGLRLTFRTTLIVPKRYLSLKSLPSFGVTFCREDEVPFEAFLLPVEVGLLRLC
jgi:hypothetical protein